MSQPCLRFGTHERTCCIQIDDAMCARKGAFHILRGGPKGGASVVCKGHFGYVIADMAEVIAQWHYIGADCAMPGTAWFARTNHCAITTPSIDIAIFDFSDSHVFDKGS